MSEDLEQQLETWMREHQPPSVRGAFIAGVESQQARIAELEAERDRLLNAAALLYGSHAQIVMDTQEDRDLQQRVLSTARDTLRGAQPSPQRRSPVANPAKSVHDVIAGPLTDLGGLLRCTVCGVERPLGDIGRKLADGWPRHCGYTMRWVTKRQLEKEESRG